VATFKPYETGERGTGEPSRWNTARDLEWIALRPELVVEVTFDHVSDGRIRHGAKVQRWREDKEPRECTLEQLGT
jgi:ATP-dependent DNA ligase